MADLYGLPSADDEALKSGDPSIGKQILFGLLSSALGTQISAPRGASVAERLAVQKYGDEQTAAQAKAKREAEASAMMEDVAKFDFAASSPQLKTETGVPVAKELPASFVGMGDERMALSKYSDYKPVEDFLKERDARGLEKKVISGIGKARSILGQNASPSTLASLALSEGYARTAPAQSATGAYTPVVNEQEAGIKLNEMGAAHDYTTDEKRLQHDFDVALKKTAPGFNERQGGVDASGNVSAPAFGGKVPSGETIKTIGLLADGASAAATIIDKLNSGNADIFTRSLLGDFNDPQVSIAFKELNDVLGRMRSGGAINADELKTFQSMTGDAKYLATPQGRKALSNALYTRMNRWSRMGDAMYGSPEWRTLYGVPSPTSDAPDTDKPQSVTTPKIPVKVGKFTVEVED